jgi:two-component system, response regulator
MTDEQEIEIILIEDNAHDAEMTMRTLKKNSLANHIVWLKDGESAMEYLFSNGEDRGSSAIPKPRLILLDLKLPKVDGLEILERLKGDDATRFIPVVVMTSSGEPGDVRECYKLGVNSYIVKPVNFDEFTEAVRQLGLYWLLLNRPPQESGETK